MHIVHEKYEMLSISNQSPMMINDVIGYLVQKKHYLRRYASYLVDCGVSEVIFMVSEFELSNFQHSDFDNSKLTTKATNDAVGIST